MVLLHGLASTCRIWDFVAPILARDFAVIAVDQRGHGDSGKPEHGYDFATVGRDVAALLEGRGIQSPVLVGHSWGADVALELAVARPGLLQGIVFVDGGTIDASARYDTLDDALTQNGAAGLQRSDAGAVHGARAVGRPVGHAHRQSTASPPRKSSSPTSRLWKTERCGPSSPGTTTCESSGRFGNTTPRELYPRVPLPGADDARPPADQPRRL